MASGGGAGVAAAAEAVPGPGGCEEEAAAEEEREVLALAGQLRRRLRGWEASLAAAQRLLVWERPPQSLAGAVALGAALWIIITAQDQTVGREQCLINHKVLLMGSLKFTQNNVKKI
ncbi:UNVERIFIED_CONTAM: hypothetical protein K2H54_013489 [Gekko kuhli]